MVYNLRYFPLQNAVCFINLIYMVSLLFIFYIQSAQKLKKQFRRQKVKNAGRRGVNASSCASMSTKFVTLSPRYYKQLCQYVDPQCVSISTLLQAVVPVCRHTVCLYLHVIASSCASMSTHSVSQSPRYCKQLCQYVDPLCVTISTLLQAAVPVS